MTTLYPIKRKCAVCGSVHEFTGIGSTNAFGHPDLDLRPPEMERSTIRMAIQRCAQCGYCATDIAESYENAAEMMGQEQYKQQLHSENFPECANSFLCYSMITANDGNLLSAAYACLHAAWICDDDDFKDGAVESRKKAIALFKRVQNSGATFAEDPGTEEALLADMMRRAELFDDALAQCENGLAKKPNDSVARVLKFQKQLILKKNAACHDLGEVFT